MRLFGDILPFIGFRNHPVDARLRKLLQLPAHVKELTFFEVEWFGRGWGVSLRPKDSE